MMNDAGAKAPPPASQIFETMLCACIPLYEERYRVEHQGTWNRRWAMHSHNALAAMALAIWGAAHKSETLGKGNERVWGRALVEALYRHEGGTHTSNLPQLLTDISCSGFGAMELHQNVGTNDRWFQVSSPGIVSDRLTMLCALDPCYGLLAERARIEYGLFIRRPSITDALVKRYMNKRFPPVRDSDIESSKLSA